MKFIPEQVGNVRKQMEKLQQSNSNSDKAETSAYFVSTASYIPNGNYGAFWGSNSNGEVFYDAQGQPFVQQAKGVIDVSAWNGQINWQELRSEGVQGAIIRLDYGSYNGYDSEALNNIRQCMSLGIPIGVYVYSYAYDSNTAYQEGSYAASLLQQAGVSPSDLPLGIYYDLEPYAWYAHPHPTNPGVYQQIVSNFFAGLSSRGYTNASVYSYPDYLESELNNSYIYRHVGWVASYSSYPGFYQWNTNFRGWQYYDEGTLNGINGYVDLDAFGYASYEPNAWSAPLNLSSYPAADLPDGDYYIDLASNLSTSLQAPSSQEGVQMNSANGNRSQGQVWYLHRNANGSYGILNTESNYWLDVHWAFMNQGNVIDQWIGNGTPAQQWFIRKVNNAYVLQSELGNICLGLSGGNAEVQAPTASSSQLFRLSAVNNSIPLNTPVSITQGNSAMQSPSSGQLAQLTTSPLTYSPSQKWEISESGDGVYSIKSLSSEMMVDDQYAQTNPGTIVDQYSSNGTGSQMWLLTTPNGVSFTSSNGYGVITASSSGLTLQNYGQGSQNWDVKTFVPPLNLSSYPAADLPDGDYYIDLASNLSTSLQAPSSQEGVQMNSANGNRSQGQVWYLHRNANGSYGILNTESNYWLDVHWAFMNQGNVIDQWIGNGTPAQQWFIRKVNNAYVLQSELGNICLGLSGGNAEVQAPTASSSQLFRLSAVNNSIPLNTPVSITQGNSAMQSPSSGQLAQLTTSPLTYSPSQKWEISESGDGVYSIKSLSSEMMVDDQYAQTNPGTIVDQYSSNGTGSQMWLLTTPNGVSFTSSNGYGVITASSSGLTLQNYGQGSQNWDVKTF